MKWLRGFLSFLLAFLLACLLVRAFGREAEGRDRYLGRKIPLT